MYCFFVIFEVLERTNDQTNTTMKNQVQVQNVTITTIHEGHELTEAQMKTTSRFLDCYKKKDGTWSVQLNKIVSNDLDEMWDENKLLRIYNMNNVEFFTYWDKKMNEWK